MKIAVITGSTRPGRNNEAAARSDGLAPAQMGRIVSEWYALNPDIRRLWVYEADESDPVDAREIHVVLALAPVCDSDDITPIWLARSTGWQSQLQRLIGRTVRLGWLDAATQAVPCEEGPEHARVCLASIGWRN